MGTQFRLSFAKKKLKMNLHHFGLFLLLVLTTNGAPEPDPNPRAAPKPKAQMAIIFNNKGGQIDYSGYDYRGFGGRDSRVRRRNHPKAGMSPKGPKAEFGENDWYWRVSRA